MPFVAEDGPVLGASLIHAASMRAGFESRLHYFNLLCATSMGLEAYREIDRHASWLLGEWLFRSYVFDNAAHNEEEFVAKVLRPGRASYGLIASLSRLRDGIPAFLDRCMDDLDLARLDAVGFSSTYQQNLPSLALAKRIKSSRPDCLLVLGGANADGPMGAALLRNFSFLDAVVCGEGDRSFPEYLAAPDQPVAGVLTRDNPRSGDAPPLVSALDMIPTPDFDDYFKQLRASQVPISREMTHLKIETSRGCWWGEKQHCIFCGLNGSAMTFRRKSLHRIIEEFEGLRRYPTRSVLVADNILDHKAFRDVIPALAERRLGLRIFFEVKANITTEQVRLLERAGVERIQPGIESLSTRILRIMNKGCRAIENVHLMKSAADAGIALTWNFLCGFPGEEEKDYEEIAALLPALFHLQPPQGLFTVQIHRFAPYHSRPEEMGMGEIRPAVPYFLAYDLPAGELLDLAFFFEPAEPQPHAPAIDDVGSLITEWRLLASKGAAVLAGVDDSTAVFIIDARIPGKERRHSYHGMKREILVACKSPVLPDELASRLRRTFGGVDDSAIENAVADLVDQELLLSLDGYLLALPLIREVAASSSDLETACEIEREIQSGRSASSA